MTTHIFIENATPICWKLMDSGHHQIKIIQAHTYYGLVLQYSPIQTTIYHMVAEHSSVLECKLEHKHEHRQSFTITLDINGDIKKVSQIKVVHIEIKNAEHHSIYTNPPPYCQFYGNARDYLIMSPLTCHVSDHRNNKLLITPTNQLDARVIEPKSDNIVDKQATYEEMYHSPLFYH